MAPDIVPEKNARRVETYRGAPKYRHHTNLRNLKKESERLKTYSNWTVSFLDSKKLANNGLYYTNSDDVVKCVFCDTCIGCWVPGDDPEKEHRRISPDCPLVRGEDCGNQVLSAEEAKDSGADDLEGCEEEEEVPSQDVCGSYALEIRPYSAPERSQKIPLTIESNNLWRDFEELGVSKISGPVSPYYATYESRLKTYENWPIRDIQPPEKLAEAGFHYTSYHDNVLCFHCGGGLKNWEVEDDPWVEHARWFSKCGFVILRKGREFVNEVLGLAAKEKVSVQTGMKEPTNGCENSQTEVKKITKEQNVSTPSCTSGSVKESQPSPPPSTEGKEIELCRICYVKEREIVFLPCGHFVSCTQCAPSLSTCAVCRKPFEATVRAYLS